MMQATSDPEVAAREEVATGYCHWLGAGYRLFAPPQWDGMVRGYLLSITARPGGEW